MLILLALALGGAHPEVNTVLALATLGLLTASLLNPSEASTISWSPPLLILLVACGATLLQLLPMPQGLIRIVAPGAHDILTMTLGDGFGWAPLSMDPPATAHELLKLVSYLCGVMLTQRLLAHRHHRRSLISWITAAGTVVTVLGLLHALVGLSRPYGVFGRAGAGLVSSFINANHLAGFLGFCGILALGLAMTARRSWRWVHLGNTILIGTAVILSLSRGGTLVFLAAVICLGLLLFVRRSTRGRRFLHVYLGLVGVLLTAGAIARTQVVSEISTLGGEHAFNKTEIWAPTVSILRDFPVLGVGRGAFQFIYPRYRQENLPATFTHLENEWLQTLVDWGPFLGLALLLGVGWAVARCLRGASETPSSLLYVGALLMIGVHNIADFNLELSAVALPVMLLLTALGQPLAGTRHESTSRTGIGKSSQTRVCLAAAAVAVTTCAVGAYAIAYDIRRDTRRLERLLQTSASDGAIRSIVERHPADFFLPLLIAQQKLAQPENAAAALPWINRGMYLAPNFSGSHRLAGRALLRLGAADQAVLEYRLACETSPHQTRAIAREVWELTQSADQVALLGKSGMDNVRLSVATALLREGAPKQALRVLRASSALESREGISLAARAHLAADDPKQALARSRELQQRWPSHDNGYLLESQAFLRSGDAERALAALQRGNAAVPSSLDLLHATSRLYMTQGRLDEARRAAELLLARAALGPPTARAHWLLGRILFAEKKAAHALREYGQARDLDPTNLNYRLGIADLRRRIKDYQGARDELQRAVTELGPSPRIDAALQRVERASAND